MNVIDHTRNQIVHIMNHYHLVRKDSDPRICESPEFCLNYASDNHNWVTKAIQLEGLLSFLILNT